MPESTFILRFTHYDSSEIEEQEHTTAQSAWAAFRAFAEPDSFEIYSGWSWSSTTGQNAKNTRWHR